MVRITEGTSIEPELMIELLTMLLFLLKKYNKI